MNGREVGLCANNQEAADLIADVNSKYREGDCGKESCEQYNELRKLDEEATKKGQRWGLTVGDDIGGSRIEADDDAQSKIQGGGFAGRGSGGTIYIDKADVNLTLSVFDIRDLANRRDDAETLVDTVEHDRG